MVGMNNYSVSELIDRLYGSFDVIHSHWKRNPPTDTHLWEMSHDKSTADILERDARDIGLYFLHADDLGTQSEIYMVAECIAYLRAKEVEATSLKQTENAIEAIGQSLMRTDVAPTADPDQVYAPISYRIGQYAYTQGIVSEAMLDAFRQALLQLGNLFLLRDGNYTTEEDSRMKEFYATLHA